MDFGDQIHRTLALLRARADALAKLRARYRYILVDEFQDTNHAQLEMLGLVAGESGNLTVVGDDDQAIYRWRGAAAANLLAFRRHHPGAREVVLTENYRSTQVILDTAARLVRLQQPAPAGGELRDRQAPALLARAGPGRPAPRLRHGLVGGGRRRCGRRGAPRAGAAPARLRDPGAQQRRRRSLPARAQRARRAAPLQRQPRALRARGDPPARLVPEGARQSRRLGGALLPRGLRALPACPRPTCCASTTTPGARRVRCSRCCASCRRTMSSPRSRAARARRRLAWSRTSSGRPPRSRAGGPARCSTASCSGRACSASSRRRPPPRARRRSGTSRASSTP